MRNKFLKKSSPNVLNILLLFSLVWPNIFSPALVIAEEIDIPVENTEIPIDTSEDILENGISTSIFENGIYTIPKVEEIEYVYPENENVRIKFTSVTEEGNLEIKKVLLSEQQRLELNTTDEYAWDFTSSMSNGSFTFDLVLPNTQGNDVEVKYTEDGTSYTALENSLVNEGYITISGLDHFTMFVVTGSIGSTVEDPNATNGQYYLRYVGDPAPEEFSHAYQWGSPYYMCSPNTNEVLFTGQINASTMIVGDVAFVGLIDNELMKSNKTGYQSGAYAYIYKNSSTTLRIGPTDGNLDREIVQVFKDYIIPGDGLINLNLKIFNGIVSVQVNGDSWISDDYGTVKTRNNVDPYLWNEFEHGAIPGWDSYLMSHVPYTFNITGCEEVLPPDITAPVVSLTSPIDNFFTNQTQVLQTWSSEDTDIDYYEYESCSNDPDTSEGSCTRIYSITTKNTSRTVNNNNISFWWRVRAVDKSGNIGNWSDSWRITIDTQSPNKPVFTAPQNNLLTNTNFIKLEWINGDDTLSGVKGYILGYTYTPANGGVNKKWNTGLRTVGNSYWHSGTYGHGEGKYVFWVKTVDFAGNESPLSDLLTVTYDATKPIAPVIEYPSNEQSFKTSPILNNWKDVSDYSGIKEYRIEYIYDDEHTFSGGPYRVTLASQRNHSPAIYEQGGVTIRVQAIDNAGNEGFWSDPVHYYYDATGPVITFSGIRYLTNTDILNINTNDSTPTILLTINDKWGTVSEASVNGYNATFDGTYWIADISSPLPEGLNTLSIKAKDQLGNESVISQDIFIDTKAPTATHTYFKDGIEITSNTAYVKGINQLSFLGSYQDASPSSGLLKDSYVIFDSKEDGSARTSKSYCGWRVPSNTVMIPYTEKVPFTNCTPSLPEGQYFMYHQVYDNAVRKDIPSITQFRDFKGLHFFVDNTLPTVSTIEDFTILEGASIPTKEVLVDDNYEISKFCYSISSDIGDISEQCITPSTSNVDLTNTILTYLSNELGITTTVADTSILPEGQYTISYHSLDMAGNNSLEEDVVFTIENVLPSLIFSSDKTTLIEGNTVIFNGQFTDLGQDDKDWTYKLSFGDLTADILGTTPNNGNVVINTPHIYTTPGDYTAQLEVCEKGGLCSTSSIVVTVNPLIVESPTTGEVAGVTTKVKPKKKTIIKTVTSVVTDILGIGGGEEEKVVEETKINEDTIPEVKGSQTCDNPSKISGYIYQDKNENLKLDEKEKTYSEISLRIYTKTDDKEETVANIKTDANGYWETTLCSGRYFVEANKDNLPNNFEIQENVQGVEINADQDTTLDFTVTDQRNFLQKYWLWLLLAITTVGGIGILLSDSRKKKVYA